MPGFCGLENDVFISYAHADNTEGWITEFETQLTNRLRQLDRDASFAVWRDKHLNSTDVFSKEIMGRLQSSGVLISILSPNGIHSGWCERERTTFEQAAARSGGFCLHNKSRALHITKAPCAGKEDRTFFGTLGHDFYRSGSQDGFFEEIDHHSAEFRKKLLQIAQEVFDLLKEVRQNLCASRGPELTVYLAPASSNTTAAEWRRRVANELTDAWNCRVVPENPDPDQLSMASVHSLIQNCDLALHWETAGQAKSIIDLLQWECALTVRPLKRIICEVVVQDPYRSSQESPRQMAGSSADPDERLRASAPDQIIQYFEDFIKARRKAPVPNSEGQRPLVYVVCAPSEVEDALLLKQCLENEGGFAAILPIRDADDGKTRLADHRNWLKTCHAVLVYWGHSSQQGWFREQQREIIAAQLKRKGQPLLALCLAVSSKADPLSDGLPHLPLQKIANITCANVRSHIKSWDPQVGRGAPGP